MLIQNSKGYEHAYMKQRQHLMYYAVNNVHYVQYI